MDELGELAAGLSTAGLSVRPVTPLRIAALRYFDAAGSFASELSGFLGGPLPTALRVVERTIGAPGRQMALAWRSPTETWLIGADDDCLAAIDKHMGDRSDGCVVEQTGGIVGVAVAGARAPDLLLRLGADAVPAVGDARTGRLAELAVMSLSVRRGEILLLVDRVHAAHLVGWIRETVADL